MSAIMPKYWKTCPHASSETRERLRYIQQLIAGVGQVTVAVWLAGCVACVTATICTALVTCTHSTVQQSVVRMSTVRSEEGMQETKYQQNFSGGRWSAARAKYDKSTPCARKLHWYEETLPKSRMTPLQLKRTWLASARNLIFCGALN